MQVVDYIGSNQERFKELVELFFSAEYRITQRASWALSLCCENDPGLLKPYFGKLLRFIKRDDVHDAVRRNGFRILQYVPIPKRYQSDLLDLSFKMLQDKSQAIAIRVFAMTVLSRIIDDYPELQRELRIIIEDEMPYAKPAFTSRGKKLLKTLKD